MATAVSDLDLVDPLELVGVTLAGRFRIDRKVAEGGFGVVYQGEQLALGRTVAIKVFKPSGGDDAAFARAFAAEARTIAALKHPGIVEVHDFGISEAAAGAIVHWMALEWLEGQTLAALLEDRRARGAAALLPTEALALLGPAIEAVGFAHQQRVVHCDLKPANIFICEERGTLVPRVLDFGIAKLMRDEGTAPAASAGSATTRGFRSFTPDYAAPEQVTYARTGPWTDVHALGLMLTELVTGEPPYAAAAVEDRLQAVVDDRRPTPARKGVDVGDWEPVLARALARRPGDRYQDAHQLLEALQGGAPTVATTALARGPSRWRLRGLVAALALIAIAVGVFAVGRLALSPRPGAPPERIMLAVLPFENLTGDAGQEYLADGLTDGLIGQLGKLLPGRLSVIARTSVNRYKRTSKNAREIAQELGVEYLLTSSVRRDGGQLRVEAHLVRAQDQTEIWSQSYQRSIEQVLVLQEELAAAVAGGVRLKLGPGAVTGRTRTRPVFPPAYEAFLRASYAPAGERPLSGSGDMLIKAAAYQEAIKLDPGFAPAHAGLAEVWTWQNVLEMPTNELRPKARAAALRAIELDDELAKAHSILASVLLNFDWDWVGADRHFRRALALDPNDSATLDRYGQMCLTVGRFAEAITFRTRAVQLDPWDVGPKWRLGAAYYYARQYDAAIEQLKRTLAFNDRTIAAYTHLGLAYVQKGMFAEALQLLRSVPESAGIRTSRVSLVRANWGYIHARAGHVAEAKAAIAWLNEESRRRYISPLSVARAHAGLGDNDETLRWLEKAYQDQSAILMFLNVDPIWDPLRDAPRFVDLVRRIGIPQPPPAR